jgi:hypothetical protein
VHVSAGWGGAGGCGAVLVRFYPDTFDPEDFPNQPTVRVLPDGSLAYSFSTPGSGLFTPPSAGPVKVFLVGGGGGGGGCGIAKGIAPEGCGGLRIRRLSLPRRRRRRRRRGCLERRGRRGEAALRHHGRRGRRAE